MKIDIKNPTEQTLFFTIFFLILLFLTAKKSLKSTIFDISQTNELKGFAMLAIIFSHIGYFLSKDTQFLFPLSILAGTGVNLFLFLSGFGLTLSAFKRPLSILEFYKKRLFRLFLPMWIVLGIFLILDFLILQRSYPLGLNIQNFFGFFPDPDLFTTINSPFWYFSWILFFYLIFPIFFSKKYPALSALAIFAAAYFITQQSLPVKEDTIKLYKLHVVAFPLGMLFAVLISHGGNIFTNLKQFLLEKFHNFKPLKPMFKSIIKILLVFIFIYTAYHSGVGEKIRVEQTISIITMISIILIFISKKITFRLFEIFGIYSYEIYLLHWPLLSRYDFLYKNFEPFIATLLYLGLFLGLGYLIKHLVDKIQKHFLPNF
jgi:peptidoglycan/LPS O-acetylase OafA/YrhL